MLDERDEMVTKARTEAGNLAHALKTLIAVIRNEASWLPEKQGAAIKAEASKMTRVVEHHLVNAQAQIKQRRVPSCASLNRVMADVRFSLKRIYPERQLEFGIADGLAAACAEDDLGEMIGNLADNACKWAARRVRISARRAGGRVLVQIDDDGLGLTDEQVPRVLARGKRLDEACRDMALGSPLPRRWQCFTAGPYPWSARKWAGWLQSWTCLRQRFRRIEPIAHPGDPTYKNRHKSRHLPDRRPYRRAKSTHMIAYGHFAKQTKLS